MKSILLPLRGFAAEVNAINLAFRLAEPGKTPVLILHCHQEEEDEAQKGWLGRVTAYAKSLSTALSVPSQIMEAKERKPADAILEAAAREHVDLIVMTAMRGSPNKHILGAVSREVVRRGKAPTLVVVSWLEDFKDQPEPVLGKILLPLHDLSEDAAALRLAAALKKSSAGRDTELIALNVTVLPAIVPMTATDLPEFRRQKEKFLSAVKQFMDKTGTKLTVKQVHARTAEQATVEVANQEGVDLIILGARRRPGPLGTFLGATSFKIATEAKAAVVLTYAS